MTQARRHRVATRLAVGLAVAALAAPVAQARVDRGIGDQPRGGAATEATASGIGRSLPCMPFCAPELTNGQGAGHPSGATAAQTFADVVQRDVSTRASVPDYLERYVDPHPNVPDAVEPGISGTGVDAFAGALRTQARSAGSPSDGVELVRSQPPQQVPAAEPVGSTGFDWEDAGAGVAFGALLVAAAVMAMRHLGRRPTTV